MEVFSTDAVNAAAKRPAESGLIMLEEGDTECCYALQGKVWVRGPGSEPWEVYTVKADADAFATVGAEASRCGGPVVSEDGARCC